MTKEQREPLTPPPPPVKVGPLNTINRVRAELAKVYKDARQGAISAADGSRLAFILVSLGKLIETSDLEQRIQNLERAAAAIEADEGTKRPWEKNGVPRY